MKIVHAAKAATVVADRQWSKELRSLCGESEVVDLYWTVEPELVTCVFCYTKLPSPNGRVPA